MHTTALKSIMSVVLAICLSVSSFVLPVFAETENGTEPEKKPEPEKFTITYKTEGKGSLKGNTEAVAGEVIALTVTPDDGYVLESVTADHSAFALSEKNTFIMPNQNITVTAKFVEHKPVKHQIWTSAGEGGTIYPAVAEVIEGEDQMFFITPAEGYKIKTVYVDNISVGPQPLYIFNAVKSFHTVRAEFEKIAPEAKPVETFTVKFYDWDGSVLSVQSVEKGKDAVAPKDPSRDGYIFKGWDTDLRNVQKDLSVIAIYEKEPIKETVIEKLYVYPAGNESSASELYFDTVKIGSTIDLKVKSYPEKELKNISFTSSNSSVAIVSSSGKVSVVGYGTSTISVTCEGKTARYVLVCLKDLVVENPGTCDD